MSARIPAESFHPGEFLREEIEARNWSQIELAEILGKSERLVSEIISGKRTITPSTAIGLAAAFGTSAQYWMNLETSYQLSKTSEQDNDVARRANLYEKFPVKTMIKRGWITATENLDVLEQQFLNFFEMNCINDAPGFAYAAKKTSYDNFPIEQVAWIGRVRQIAKAMVTSKYSEKSLRESLDKLKTLLISPEEIRHVPRILSECGIRFVLVEALPKSQIDGACLWLNKASPVIGMSMRYDRIDNFWFVLRHEIEHVLQKHGQDGGCIDVGLESENSNNNITDEKEQVANAAAAEFCVPQADLQSFISRVSPFFSEQRVVLFAQRLKVHPGIVVGQLHRRLGRYDLLKSHQVKVRALILPSARADGWGFSENIALRGFSDG